MQSADIYDCAVIGGGPGGLVSTLYLSRFQRKVVLIDAGHSRAQWIPRIRNLIGYGAGLNGKVLLRKLKAQVLCYPQEWIHGEAIVKKKKDLFEVHVDQRVIKSKTVILATGMKDRQPPLGNVNELRRKEVLAYCPICDGYDHRDQVIGLLVCDNKGLHKMKFLSQFSKSIEVFKTREFKISSQNKKLARELNIPLHPGSIVEMKFNRRPRGIQITLGKQRDRSIHFANVAYVALGVDFNLKTTAYLKGLRRTRDGFIVTKSHQETSIPGLYAVGDCVNALAQVSVAIGQAALAATRIHNRLPPPE